MRWRLQDARRSAKTGAEQRGHEEKPEPTSLLLFFGGTSDFPDFSGQRNKQGNVEPRVFCGTNHGIGG